ncbi:Ku protein [Polaromonas sp.]|uniref:non-homologous end joining protein Ku n=1 Tax=Polaromonas sp. TaxID=1869339 RepID=UPI00352A3A44
MGTGSRTIWKGAITFGLVHIPVGLHTASIEQGVDFDWLDKRTMDPVGYKRINKKTGKEIDKENIVKGIAYEDGKYVIISPDEIEAVFPRTTQTIEIQRFIEADGIPFVYLERPYYLAPIGKGDKVYALLREVLLKTGKVGLAKVVIATKQHLAVLVPSDRALVLNLLRWGDEVRSFDGLDLPSAGVKGAGISAAEMKMAEQLVMDMSGDWKPDDFKDEFKHQVMKLVAKKVKAGKTETVMQPEEEAAADSAQIIDLAELLAQSLKGGSKTKATGTPRASAKKKATASKKSSAGKTVAVTRMRKAA